MNRSIYALCMHILLKNSNFIVLELEEDVEHEKEQKIQPKIPAYERM